MAGGSRCGRGGRSEVGLSPTDGAVTVVETIAMASPTAHPEPRRLGSALRGCLVVAVLVAVAGCGAAPAPTLPGGSPSTSTASASVPSGGRSLRELNISNGPEQFTVPASVGVRVVSDQTQQVTLVIGNPTPAQVGGYLQRTLPDEGFTVTRAAADAILFTGYGWTGSFVVTGAISAVTLQKQ